MNATQHLAANLRVDGAEINVPRNIDQSTIEQLLDGGLIVLVDEDETRNDRRYAATDYARDVIEQRLPGDGGE